MGVCTLGHCSRQCWAAPHCLGMPSSSLIEVITIPSVAPLLMTVMRHVEAAHVQQKTQQGNK